MGQHSKEALVEGRSAGGHQLHLRPRQAPHELEVLHLFVGQIQRPMQIFLRLRLGRDRTESTDDRRTTNHWNPCRAGASRRIVDSGRVTGDRLGPPR